MKRSAFVVIVLALTAGAAASAQAQAAATARPFSVGVSGGVSFPTGDLTKDDPEFGFGGSSTGFNVNGIVGYTPVTMPIGLRAELNYSRFGLKDLPSGVDGNTSVAGGSLNAVFNFPTGGTAGGGMGVSPYLIGGVGYAQFKGTLEASGVEFSGKKSGFGLNGGIGIRIPLSGFHTFAEVRYHYLFTEDDEEGTPNVAFVPLSFGIMF